MSYLLTTVNDNLLSCVAACPVECEITAFSGAVSFSQLSSQATNKLLGSKANVIGTDYANALELYYRLNYNNPFLDQLMALSRLTQSSIGQLTDSLNLLSKIRTGLDLFNKDVDEDMANLNNVLLDFQLLYNKTFKASRLKAGKYITETYNCLHDLDFILILQPTSFSNFSVAYWAYINLASLLNICIVNTNLAVTYLAEALNLERKTGDPLIPDQFYKSEPTDNVFENYPYYDNVCRNFYEVVSGTLKRFAPILNLASQKVSFWLQTNTANIENLTKKTTQSASNKPYTNYFTTSNQGIITEEYISNSFYASTSKSEYSTKFFHSVTEENNEYFSGFWTLLECESCDQPLNKTWNELIASLTSSVCYTASQCLMAYESSLFDTIASSLLSIASTPTFSPSDRLKTSLLNINAQTTHLEENIHSYIVGTISGKNLSTLAGNILNSMSLNLSIVEDEMTVLLRGWENDVATWSSSIISQYLSVCDNLYELSRFVYTSTQLSSTVASLTMWLQPRIIYKPVASIMASVTDSAGTMKSIEKSMQVFIGVTGKQTVEDTMSAISNDIVKQLHQVALQVKVLSNYWSNEQSFVVGLLNDFNAQLIIDDVFVQ